MNLAEKGNGTHNGSHHGGGPKTQIGKARSSRNAIRHGLLAQNPVLKGENETPWITFRDRVVDQIMPLGALEEALALRAATLMWRLARATEYETATLNAAITPIPQESIVQSQLKVARLALKSARVALRVAERVASQNGSATGDEAYEFMSGVIALTQRIADPLQADLLKAMGVSATDDDPYDREWTCAELWTGLTYVAAASGVTSDQLSEQILASRRNDCENGKSRTKALILELRRLAQEIAQGRACQSMLADDALDRLIRYEAHLQRLLTKTLNDLGQFQGDRAGPSPTINLRLQRD